MRLRRPTRYLAPALLLLLGTCTGLALAEVAVRVLDPHTRDHALPGGFFLIDAAMGWRQRPTHAVTHSTRYFEVRYTTNGLGYRDTDRRVARTPGRTRVLLFGDSQVFGWGIAQGRRFTDLLEAGHPSLEVWNLGVMGYGLDQQLLEYEVRAEGWGADVVVLLVTPFTLHRATKGYLDHKHKPQFVLRGPDSLALLPPAGSGTSLTRMLYRLAGPWYLPYFVDRRLRPALVDPEGSPATRALGHALFARAVRTAHARAQRLILLTNLKGDALAWIRGVGDQLGFEVVAVGLPEPELPWLFGPDDRHWNERAHGRVADLLWERLAADTIHPNGAR